MRGDRSYTIRAATPDDVLEFLQADYRLRGELDPEVYEDTPLTADTTIAEWQSLCDLVAATDLAPQMNRWFDMDRPIDEWDGMLRPENTRTLGDIAQHVAAHAHWPAYRALRVAGSDDAAAGVFFCVRAILARKGVDVHQLRPSTPITASLAYALGSAAAKLAPGVVFEPRFLPRTRHSIGGTLVATGLVGLFVGIIARRPQWLIAVDAATVMFGVMLGRGEPTPFELGSCRTVGELARAIARSRRPAS